MNFLGASILLSMLAMPVIAAGNAALTVPPVSSDAEAPTGGRTQAPVATASNWLIPARTIVSLELLQPVSTRSAKAGDRFDLRVMQAVTISGQIAIPAGSPALGEVIHAQKGGVFGKAGELLLTIRHIDLNGQQIPMRLFKPAQGKDRGNAAMATTITAAVTIPVAGMFAAFIKGGEIELPSGMTISAIVARDTALSAPTPASTTHEQGSKP